MIKVVAALIENNDKYLIAKRSTGDISLLGKWEFPGGKVDLDEDEFKAIEREIKEEFDIAIKAEEFIVNNIYYYPNKTIDLKLYKCNYISGILIAHDHSEYKWVSINEMQNYDFAPADIFFVDHLKKQL